MTHYFITTFFNYCNYEKRYILTKEFLERYPNVILIEVAFGDQEFKFSHIKNDKYQYRQNEVGWITNKVLNRFIHEHPDLESLTFIDSDVKLYNDFFEEVKFVYENIDRPLYLQPYSVSLENYNGKIIERSSVMYAYKEQKHYSTYFNTGLIYSYNKKFLDIIMPLPECLVLGGYDYFLYLCLFKLDSHIIDLYNEIRNFEVIEELKQFRNRFIGIKGENFNFMYGSIYNFSHGKKENRGYNIRNYKYRYMTDYDTKQKIIKEYFQSRKEDE